MISESTGGLPRYCHPYHGGWDVARIALDIPESRILFLCPVSCARIICLNAIKYGYKDRIDVLALTEDDIVSGNYEEKTLEAAFEVLENSNPRPKALILYVTCIDSMLGNDHSFQTETIMERFPGVNCFVLKMCPITRFSGDLPLVALQHDMYAALPEETVPKEKIVTFLGSNIALGEESELVQTINAGGYRVLHIQSEEKYAEFLKVRASSLNLCLMPFGRSAGELLRERYGTPFLPYFAKYDFDEIDAVIKNVCGLLEIPLPDLSSLREETEQFLRKCAEEIDGCPLAIDSSAVLFPDILRKTLEHCGFTVEAVYADDIQRSFPDVDSGSIHVPTSRSYSADHDVIAIGMVSASFSGASRAVDMFYDNGEWGYYGLRCLGERIVSAYKEPKSVKQLRKEARQ